MEKNGKYNRRPHAASEQSGGNFQSNQPVEGLFIGRNAVIELLKSGREVDRVFVRKGERDGSLSLIAALALEKGIPLLETDVRKLDSLSAGGVHQGVAAIAAETAYLSVQELLEQTEAAGQQPFYLICDEVSDPHNLGAMIRSAECAGCNGIIIPKRRSAGLTAIVGKTSAGAVEYMKVARVVNINNAISELKDRGVWIFGTAAEGSIPMYKADLAGPAAIVIGNEGQGMSPLVRKNCDVTVHIPMNGRISSLNASAAASILLYEAVRQRLG